MGMGATASGPTGFSRRIRRDVLIKGARFDAPALLPFSPRRPSRAAVAGPPRAF